VAALYFVQVEQGYIYQVYDVVIIFSPVPYLLTLNR